MLLGIRGQDWSPITPCFYRSTSVYDGIYLRLWNIYRQMEQSSGIKIHFKFMLLIDSTGNQERSSAGLYNFAQSVQLDMLRMNLT